MGCKYRPFKCYTSSVNVNCLIFWLIYIYAHFYDMDININFILIHLFSFKMNEYLAKAPDKFLDPNLKYFHPVSCFKVSQEG